jgi:hypothetical protein
MQQMSQLALWLLILLSLVPEVGIPQAVTSKEDKSTILKICFGNIILNRYAWSECSYVISHINTTAEWNNTYSYV